mmetsp:Transcript_38569/g.99998  ORF Transcript_38569/g.99998 Transcript_38569/m.99998 type:complete len:206 (+) Transcript_38569:1307-1924(+)
MIGCVRVQPHVVPTPLVLRCLVASTPKHWPSPRAEYHVHELRQRQGHHQVDHEDEHVFQAQLHTWRPIVLLWACILVRAKHDETKHVLVVAEEGAHQNLGPRLDTLPRKNRTERSEGAVRVTVDGTPHVVICQHAKHPEGIAPVNHVILEHRPLRQLLHLAQRVHRHLAGVGDISRGNLDELLQVVLAVWQLRHLIHDHEVLRHV